MLKTFLGCIPLFTGLLVASETAPHLRVGYAQTPEEASKELSAIRAKSPSLADWEKRKATIRQGVLKGLRLDPLPEKTPLQRYLQIIRACCCATARKSLF